MRKIKGRIVLPPDSPSGRAGQVIIEIRDVSVADAASKVIAENRLKDVRLAPNGKIDFELPVPEAEANHTLSFRVHIDVDGSNITTGGDLLTTAHIPVPNKGTPGPFELPVEVI